MRIVSNKKYKQLESRLFNHNGLSGSSSHKSEEFSALIDEYTSSQTFWQLLTTPYYKMKNYGLFSKIKYAFQRMKKGYCDEDVWDIDDWFLNIMPNMLCELKENKRGVPTAFCEEIYRKRHLGKSESETTDAFRFNKVDSNEFEAICAEWDKTLEHMAYLFREACKGDNSGENRKQLDEAFALFTKYFNCLWW